MQRGEERDPIMAAVLTMVTCGFYGLYWLYVVMQELNQGLGREEFNPILAIVLTFVTCGFYGFYVYWKIANATVELQQRWGLEPNQEAVILFVLFVVLAPAGVFLTQQALNETWTNGTPGGAAY